MCALVYHNAAKNNGMRVSFLFHVKNAATLLPLYFYRLWYTFVHNFTYLRTTYFFGFYCCVSYPHHEASIWEESLTLFQVLSVLLEVLGFMSFQTVISELVRQEKRLTHTRHYGTTLLWSPSMAREERSKTGEKGAEMLLTSKNFVDLSFLGHVICFSFLSSGTPQKRFLNPVLYCAEWNAKMNGLRHGLINAITIVI